MSIMCLRICRILPVFVICGVFVPVFVICGVFVPVFVICGVFVPVSVYCMCVMYSNNHWNFS